MLYSVILSQDNRLVTQIIRTLLIHLWHIQLILSISTVYNRTVVSRFMYHTYIIRSQSYNDASIFRKTLFPVEAWTGVQLFVNYWAPELSDRHVNEDSCMTINDVIFTKIAPIQLYTSPSTEKNGKLRMWHIVFTLITH